MTTKSKITKMMDAWRDYPIIGARDSLALSGISAGIAAAHPAMQGNILAMSIGAILGAIGGYSIFNARISKAYSRVDMDSAEGFILPSDEPYEKEGLLMGYTKDTHSPIGLPFDLINYHMAIIGASGYGKTTLLMYMLYQQMRIGGGFIFGDAKIDYDTSDTLGAWAKAMNRESEFYIINFDDPEASNTYNPALEGDANEVASRLMNLMPDTGSNAGADHYRSSVHFALTTIIAAAKACKWQYTFTDLSILMQSSAALESLLTRTPVGSEERINLEVFLDKYRKIERSHDGVRAPIDMAKLKDALGGLGNRIGIFSQGKFGQIMNTYTPEINLYDIIRKNNMLYIMLPTMGKNEEAIIFMKMLIGDLRSAVARLQKIPKSLRPRPPFLVPIDEFGAVAMEKVTTLFEQARSAGLAMIPGFQTFGQLTKVAEGFDDILLQNTTTKAYFKFGTNESAERAAEIIGKTKRYSHTITSSEGVGDGAQTLRATPQASISANMGQGESFKDQEEYRVSIENLKALGRGECVMQVGSRIYHLMIPMIETQITRDEGRANYRPMRHKTRLPKGTIPANLVKQYKEFLTVGVAESMSVHQKDTSKPEQPQKAAQAEQDAKLLEYIKSLETSKKDQ